MHLCVRVGVFTPALLSAAGRFSLFGSERGPKREQMLRGRRGEAVKITVVELEAVVNTKILWECVGCARLAVMDSSVGAQFGFLVSFWPSPLLRLYSPN